MNPFEEISEASQRWSIDDAGICIDYEEGFLPPSEADQLFDTLKTDIVWQRHVLNTPAGPRTVPRMTSWHADHPLTYRYGQIHHAWQDWNSSLIRVRDLLAERLHLRFNGVLANFYENERDSVAPHSDDESDMVEGFPIASVSLGHARDFVVRHRVTKSRHVLSLGHGSLLVMRGNTQRVSTHAIPKAKHSCGPRINLTFRRARNEP